MQLPVMAPAKRYGKFITDFKAECARLGKAQMMRIRWLSATDETRPGGNELQVRLVAQTLGLGERELALVDLATWGCRHGWCQRRGS